MNPTARALATATTRPALYQPPGLEQDVGHWRINGYPAIIIIWTSDEWERLPERPADAQYFPRGRVWCALRME